MDERTKQAFEFARDSTKLLITLSTGIIALTITFLKEIIRTPSGLQMRLLAGVWISFLLSVVLGVWTMLALTGTLEPLPKEPCEPSIRGGNVTKPALMQIFTFLVGLGLTVCFGIVSLA